MSNISRYMKPEMGFDSAANEKIKWMPNEKWNVKISNLVKTH